MKRLGQYFLKNQTAIKKIIAALDIKEGNTIIEIGPGHGELTLELLKFPINLVAIEKDKVFIEDLIKKSEIPARGEARPRRRNPKSETDSNDQNSKLKIIEGDALKIIKSLILNLQSDYKLMGNIPYYITGHLLRILSELENKPELTVLTIQKEVAERIVAKPPKMNRLAAITQFWAEPEIVMTLKPNDFDPPPKVDSAIVKFKLNPNYLSICDRAYLSNYYKTVKILFQQPRKTILNNLQAGLKLSKEEILEKLKSIGLTGQERPQDLSIETIINVSKIFQ